MRVGVTGHRSFKEPEAVHAAIRRLIDRIASTLTAGSRAPLTWTVISPLARGADREVASAILDGYAGRLEVVLPLPLEDYRNDFDKKEDLEEFDALFARKTKVLSSLVEGGTRDDHYHRAGEMVVDESEIIITVWDGNAASGTGGTAEIVALALEFGRIVFRIDRTHPTNPPQVIRKGRDGKLTFHRFPRRRSAISRSYARQSAYCEETVASDSHSEHRREFRDLLLETAADTKFPFASFEAALDPLIDEYAHADRLAVHYQARHHFAVRTIAYLAAGGVTVGLFQVLFDRSTKVILFEVAAMLAVFALWVISRIRAWHDKWIEDRHLAERLRSAIFLILADAVPSESGEDDPLPFYRGPEAWIRKAVDSLSIAANRQLPERPFQPLRDFIAAGWLDKQIAFHHENAHRNHRMAGRLDLLTAALFVATLLAAVLHEMEFGHHVRLLNMELLDEGSWITLFALALPVWAGTIHAVAGQLELERIAARSTRMNELLKPVASKLRSTKTHQELRPLVKEAAVRMKVENREWWGLLSFQDVRLHV